MASEKRKATTDARPSKKAKGNPEEKPAKDTSASKPRNSSTTDRRPVAKSVLLQEEKAFPRGGANVLTPLEQKQIRAQAERDVLFEQETGKAAPRQDEDELFAEETPAASSSKKRKREVKDGKDTQRLRGPKISSLSYKSLVPGSLVLGRIVAITNKDLALALPNNLTGYVPITAISQKLNERIQALIDDDEDEEEDVDLHKIFHVGQWLRAVVTEPEDARSSAKRHIQLSINPAAVNAQISIASVVPNCLLQAAVRSVEDYGIVIDTGLNDTDVKGFVGKKELGQSYKAEMLQEGQVMLCMVTGMGSDGKVLKLSADTSKFWTPSTDKKGAVLSELSDVEVLLPGTLVDILVTDTSVRGIAGKIAGMVDVSADGVHSGFDIAEDEDVTSKHKIASKSRARITWSVPGDDGARQVGVSLLPQIVQLTPAIDHLPTNATEKARKLASATQGTIALSTVIAKAVVSKVLLDRGVYLDLYDTDDEVVGKAFAHISQLADSHVGEVSADNGKYKLGTSHKARILGFNPLDGLYYGSLQESILSQAFLRMEDIKPGQIVDAKVQSLQLGGKTGLGGVVLRLTPSITAFVPALHMSDTALQHPEKKFREGYAVKARILSVDVDKRAVKATMKKTLVNDGGLVWKDYAELAEGQEGKGTIIKLMPKAAIVQYFGPVRAFLPISEMSDSFVDDPTTYFKLGQTVSTRITSIDAGAEQLRVSCRIAMAMDAASQKAWDAIEPAQIITGSITNVLAEKIEVEIEGGVAGFINLGQLSDGSASKAQKMHKQLRVGQKLTELLVLSKVDKSQQVQLSYKSSLIKDAKAGKLIKSREDVVTGEKVHGWVQNITPEGVYVEFAARVAGLLPKGQLSPEARQETSFGLSKDQTVSVWILNVDDVRQRFALTMLEPTEDLLPQKTAAPVKEKTKAISTTTAKTSLPTTTTKTQEAVAATTEKANPPSDADAKKSVSLTIGALVKGRVLATKSNQVNVLLEGDIQGRIDVSEVYDKWSDIKNAKAPLSDRFKIGDVVDAKILGVRDAKDARYLPITQKLLKKSFVDLSVKPSRVQKDSKRFLDGLKDLKVGETYTGFINNLGAQAWVNISPNIRGRIALTDLTNDPDQLKNMGQAFPLGSALQVKATAIDVEAGQLDLTPLDGLASKLTLHTIKAGDIVAGRITKVSDTFVTVQLSSDLAASIQIAELSDDFDTADTARFHRNEIIRAKVINVDQANKRITLSARPSLVLSSSLPVKDAFIANHERMTADAIVRGFIKHFTESGVIVSLSGIVDAFVSKQDLDTKSKDWRAQFKLGQLVQGRVIAVNAAAKQVRLSIKKDALKDSYKARIKIEDLKVGAIVSGKIRKVEDYGVFVAIDNTVPRLSGLAHKSELAETKVVDARKLYNVGDRVKVKVIKLDETSKKIGLSLKAAHFQDDNPDEEELADGDVVVVQSSDDEEGGLDLNAVVDMEEESSADEMDVDEAPAIATTGLSTGGFDWNGNGLDTADGADYESEAEIAPKKKRKLEIKVDMTGDLDKYGPRSTSDFERQLLGQPNDSALWIQYMAFHLELSEIEKARQIAERAIKTIHIRETDEKANIWIARLNLEAEYGNKDSVEKVFKAACQMQDPLSMHEKLASIYIDSGKHDKADAIFERIIGNKTFRASPEVWLNYATFLMTQLQQPEKAHALLPRAMQSVPKNEHRLLTAKFAALEFRTESGDAERGRTIYEGLVSEWPKWTTGWDMWVDIEQARIVKDGKDEEAIERVRSLYERMSQAGMKKKRAKFVFKRWLEFEEGFGNAKSQEQVKIAAKDYVEKMQSKGDEDE